MVHHNHQYIVRGSSGQSLIEVLVAIGIGVLFIVAAVSLIAPALKVNTTANSAQTAGALSKELGDNVRAWAGGSWNNVFSLATSSANQYYLNTLFSPFAAAQGTETITAGSSTYQRYFYVDDVYRDSNGNATSTASGNSYDPSTKKITIVSVPATLGPAISSWPTTTPSSYATQSASAVAYNGYIYETGGEDPQTGDSTSGVIYAPINSNGTVGTWSPTTKMPRSLRGHSAVVYNSYIYTTGAQGNFVGYTSTVQYASINANGTLGSWTSTTALPIGLADHSAVVYKGYIYTTGGEPTTGGFTSTVQYAPINSDRTICSWTNTTALPNVLIQ